MSMPEQFWMVYGVDQGAPTVRHPNVASATDEAKRLARANPGVVFVILKAIGAVVKNDLQTTIYDAGRRFGDVDDDIPF